MGCRFSLIIEIKNITSGTITNADALPLKLEMDKALKQDNSVVLSFKGIELTSTSFLNSSLGEMVEQHGFEALKGRFSLAHITPELKSFITKYLDDMRQFAS